MNQPIYVWRYVLKSRAKLNAVSSQREFEGALIRVGEGFGCLHSWPELGDPGLGELLGELKGDSLRSGISDQALSMASIDGNWRTRGASMMESIEDVIPESHATLVECTLENVQEAVARGFSVLKVKGRRDYSELAGRMDEVSHRWPHLRWRVDFNEVLTKEEALCFVQCLTDAVWKRIDFIEDPCPYDCTLWRELERETKLKLAADQSMTSDVIQPVADVLVVKPSRKDCTEIPPEQCLVVTSNMDHPLGQCFAAWRAASFLKLGHTVEVCGLQTQDLFEPNEFSERLGLAGPKFRAPGGTGFGFDDLLEKLPWKRLV